MYKIAICDDNKKYVDFLEQIICQVSEKPQDNIIYKFYSGEEFLENPASSFDLLFLDMKMEKVDGMAAALKYRESDQDGILVFCSGIQMLKPEFFDVHPFRYLMKSYSREKLIYEIRLILEKMIENKKETFLIVCSDGRMNKVPVRDILYISNRKHGSNIHTFSKQTQKSEEFICNRKLKEIYEELKNQYFEYAHNSYIVNFQAVVGLKNNTIQLEDSTVLNISRSKKERFHKRFSQYLGQKYRRNRREEG